MNEEIIKHAEAISEILRKEYNPHVRVEVEAYGLKVVSDEWFKPVITEEDAKDGYQLPLVHPEVVDQLEKIDEFSNLYLGSLEVRALNQHDCELHQGSQKSYEYKFKE